MGDQHGTRTHKAVGSKDVPSGLNQRGAIRKALRGGAQPKLAVSRKDDPCEREADNVADGVMQDKAPHPVGASLQSASIQCSQAEKDCNDIDRDWNAEARTGENAQAEILSDHENRGIPLPAQARGFFEPRFGTDFSGVRIHDDQRAARLARSIGARAFTHRGDIYFNHAEYQPNTASGRRLLAHELTHVVQQGAGRALPVRSGGARVTLPEEDQRQKLGGSVRIQCQTDESVIMRDLAIEPPNPEATGELTEDQINTAIRYNTARFQDPYTIMIVRDVVGIPKYPAVSDRDLALAVAQYQAHFNLDIDGRVGPATTRALVRELRAGDQRRFARLLREDNRTTWGTVNGPAYRACGEFQWDVDFTTTLREGWLIQRIDNTWNATSCAGVDVTPAFTTRYWEAWWVDRTGEVWIPTSTATPPSTGVPATADDLWFNPPIANSNGTWSQAGTMYSTLTLPAGFAIHAVPEAGDLPSTVGPVSGDDLGLPEGSRRRTGRWDCCDPDPAKRFHRAS